MPLPLQVPTDLPCLTPEGRALWPELDTGDILLFGGSSATCRRIKRISRSPWSHAALLLRSGEEIYLWEATSTADMVDLDTGLVAAGVRCVRLRDWIALYPEDMVVRRLYVERNQQLIAALNAFRAQMRGRPYEKSKGELLRASYNGPLGHNRQEDLSSLFCSELVAAAFQRMGLLPAHPPSNEYTPRDFSTARRPALALLGGATLGPEIHLCR